MPIKKRLAKRKAHPITPEAVARWREIRPHGIVVEGGRSFIADDALAEALGEHALLALPEAAEIRDELEALTCL